MKCCHVAETLFLKKTSCLENNLIVAMSAFWVRDILHEDSQ